MVFVPDHRACFSCLFLKCRCLYDFSQFSWTRPDKTGVSSSQVDDLLIED